MKIILLIILGIYFIRCNPPITCFDRAEEFKKRVHNFVISKKQENMSGRNESLYKFDSFINSDTIEILQANAPATFIDGDTSNNIPSNLITLYEASEIGDTVIKYTGTLQYKLHKSDTVLILYSFCQGRIAY